MPISMPESGQNHHLDSAKERQSAPPSRELPNDCIECGKPVSWRAKRCKPCAVAKNRQRAHERNQRLRGGKPTLVADGSRNHCEDCGKGIKPAQTRCTKCQSKRNYKLARKRKAAKAPAPILGTQKATERPTVEVYIEVCCEVVAAIRDQCHIEPEAIDILVSAEPTMQATKRLLMGLRAAGVTSVADTEQFFADGELKGL